MKKRESIFKENVTRDLKRFAGVYFLKTQERGRRGVPDIIGCLNGKFFALELKTDEGKVDLLQLNRIEKIRASGGFALVTAPATWVRDLALLTEALL